MDMFCKLTVMVLVGLCAAFIVGCSSDIDRGFGPEVMHGTGMLPGVVITTGTPTGV